MKRIIKALLKTLLLLALYTLLATLLFLIERYFAWLLYVLLIIGTIGLFIQHFKDEEE